MKRILLSVLAATVTAAWAVPAHAEDIFTFSGQYRLRTEWRDDENFNKNVPPDAQDSWGQRIRLTGNVKATDDTSVKISIQDTTIWGTEGLNPHGGPNLSTVGIQGNRVDFHEGYLNVNNVFGVPVTVRAGRQELVYGDQRLIGNFDWSNNARSFDALKLMYASDMLNVDAFWSKLNDSNVMFLDSSAVPASGLGVNDTDFYGIYSTLKMIPNNTLDIYVLNVSGNFSGDPSTVVGGNYNPLSNLTTIGARLNGAVEGLDYTVEVPFQFGTDTTASNAKTDSWAAAAKAHYTFATTWKPKVGVEYDYAEGTSKGDGTNHTFFNLFPTNHNKFGIMDLAAWRNLVAYDVNASIQPTEKLTLYTAWWNLNKASAGDNWYWSWNWNNSGNGLGMLPVQKDTTSSHKSIGNEIDLVATYKYSNPLTIEGGYAHFFAGDYVKDAVGAGNKADQDYAYVMLTANF